MKILTAVFLGILNGFFWSTDYEKISIFIITTIIFEIFFEQEIKIKKEKTKTEKIKFKKFEEEMKKIKLERRRKK